MQSPAPGEPAFAINERNPMVAPDHTPPNGTPHHPWLVRDLTEANALETYATGPAEVMPRVVVVRAATHGPMAFTYYMRAEQARQFAAQLMLCADAIDPPPRAPREAWAFEFICDGASFIWNGVAANREQAEAHAREDLSCENAGFNRTTARVHLAVVVKS